MGCAVPERVPSPAFRAASVLAALSAWGPGAVWAALVLPAGRTQATRSAVKERRLASPAVEVG